MTNRSKRYGKEHANEFPIVLMCEVLALSSSGYYDWLGRMEIGMQMGPRGGRRIGK